VDSNHVELVPGMDVYGSDNEKLGSIDDVQDGFITVKQGFFSSDVSIPLDAIEGVDREDRVFLYASKDAALREEWTNVGAAGMVDDNVTLEQTTTTQQAATGFTDAAVSGTDATRVPVYEEDLTAVKRQVSRGAVRIEKNVVTEDRTISVPVTEEQVRVTRVDVDASTPVNAADAFQEGVIEVQLTGEEVELQKTAHLAGEVVVEKDAVQRNETVGGTVRREEVHVDEDTVQGITDSDRSRI